MSSKIPEGYQKVTPYLIIPNAAGFIEFTKGVFGAELINKYMRNGESLIMHGEIKIGDSVIMFADSTEQYQPQPAGFFIYVENADETYQKALDKGASSVTQISNQSYGRSGGVKDASGNTWWITEVI
jgi:PhnB protein